MKQCSNGHFYDETRFGACPYCQPEQQSFGATMPAPPVAPTMPVSPAPDFAARPQANDALERAKTVGLIKKGIGIDPAVGFLICVAGAHKGADFRLVAGRNFIGRSPSMDICLPDDDTISRENHCMITYDMKHNSFIVSPGQGRGVTYLKDNIVETPTKLEAYDVIEVGETELLFLPLCSDKFTWS